MFTLALAGLMVGWSGFVLTMATPGRSGGANILHLMTFAYIIFDHIVPLMVFRGREGRRGATEGAQTVGLSGRFTAKMKIAPALNGVLVEEFRRRE